MADLVEVVGGILKDLASARVMGDLFSRDASLEYRRDAILREFPVPRLDIKDATIQLKFAVNAVERKPVDEAAVFRVEAERFAQEIAREVVVEVVEKSPVREAVLEVARDKKLKFDEQVAAAVRQVLAEDPRALAAVKKPDLTILARLVGDAAAQAVTSDAEVRRRLSRVVGVTALRSNLRQLAGAKSERLVQDFTRALEAAQRQALRVDVAVTRQELAEVPEAVVSNLNLVVEIRNYEWTEVEVEEGKMVSKLRPE